MTVNELYNKIVELTPYKSDKDIEFRDVLCEALEKYQRIVRDAWNSGNIEIDECVYNDVRKYIGMINESVTSYYLGKHHQAYEKLSELLSLYRKNDYWSLTQENLGWTFYRMRTKEEETSSFTREDMFHVPFNMRRKIRTQRYSILGYPCLYGGLSVYVCWEELGRPKSDCWVSILETTKETTFLDLTIPNPQKFLESLPKYLRYFPLIISCMVLVAEGNREFAYKPEYIIPQLLMEWFKNDSKGIIKDGILYNSVMCDIDDGGLSSMCINVAIPARGTIGKTLFCPDLANIYQISEPKILVVKQAEEETISSHEKGITANDKLVYRNPAFRNIEKELKGAEVKEVKYLHE